jgi:hypothetical protein
MNSNSNNNICDDWGWYFDTEQNSYINSTANTGHKKIIYKLSFIEDEYTYHKNNYRDIENLELDSAYKKIEKTNNTGNIFLLRIGSTTLITALLTYAIFFLI